MRQLKITQTITSRESESVALYLKDIDKYPLLSTDEEVELAQRIHKGDLEARDLLVKSNLRFVVSVAKQMCQSNQTLSLMDLISEGNAGLVRAADRFDETRGFKFISYSVWWIRQAIMQAICEQGSMVRVPQNKLGNQHKIFQYIAEFEQKHERRPSADEIAEGIDLPIERVRTILGLTGRPSSIDSPLKEGEDGTLVDVMPNANADATDNGLDSESLQTEIQRALSALPKRERDVLRYTYGLGCVPASVDEIGEKMCLSRERVRQIREKATRALRAVANVDQLRAYM